MRREPLFVNRGNLAVDLRHRYNRPYDALLPGSRLLSLKLTVTNAYTVASETGFSFVFSCWKLYLNHVTYHCVNFRNLQRIQVS